MKPWTCQIINESMSFSSSPMRARYDTGQTGLLLSAGIEYIVAAVSTIEAIVCELRESRAELTADSFPAFERSMKLTTFTESFALFISDLMT